MAEQIVPFSTKNLADGPEGVFDSHMYRSRWSLPSNSTALLQFRISQI